MLKKTDVLSSLISILIFICFTPLSRCYAQSQKGIQFIHAKDWREVMSIAKSQQKAVFVDAYTTWCGPCKMMDNDIYTDSLLGVQMNKDFISIKVQMDSTKNDDEYIRSWYKDAKFIFQTAKIEAFPTLLYYSASGELLLKTIGYKDVPAMITLADFAGNPIQATNLKSDLEKYKSGTKDFTKLISLSRFAKQILKDDKLALQIAIDFKKGYLDKISEKEFYNQETLRFIREYGLDLVSVDDHFFKLCYNDPGKIDTIIGNGNAAMYVTMIIERDVIKPMLYKNEGEAITKHPDWNAIQANIRKRYPKVNYEAFILDQKISFSENTKQWDDYSIYVSSKFELNPPKPDDAFWIVNGSAWKVFLNTSSKAALQRALKWSNLSLELQDNLQFYDTKANILYRLGRTQEAMEYQKLAVKKNEELIKKEGRDWFPDYKINLRKMEKGEPTWPIQ